MRVSTELTAAVGFAIAGAVSLVATPAAIAMARRTDFYDRPRDYRRHRAPTPFLGGAAVLVGFLAAAIALGAPDGRLLVLLGCAIGLWLLGTIDDRTAIAPKWRLLAEAFAAVALIMAGLGWSIDGGDALDGVLSVVWIVGLVNAFNLMDNLDGACAGVGCVSAAGIGTLAAIHGQPALTGLAFALAGACAAFLRWNLARPARIFLGDGGSMLVGFLVAALAMAVSRHLQAGATSLLACALLAGLPILDTTLVSVSRLRRGVALVTGGRDHLTHRLLLGLHSPRRVAAALVAAQAILCSLAIVGEGAGVTMLVAFSVATVSLGLIAIAWLDTARWRPNGISVGARSLRSPADKPSVGIDPG